MNLKLIAWAPGKRFDAERKLCSDGRGGWVFSQVNVDRHITDYEDYWLVFYCGVLVQSANEDDYVESTHLTATLNGQEIGEHELEWKRPNPMWGYANGDAIFEFSQPIMMQPTKDGLITFSLRAKLNSQPDWLPISGNGYCRIKLVDQLEDPDRWVGATSFSFRSLFSKSVWGAANRKRG